MKLIDDLSRNCGVAKNFGALHDYKVRDLGELTDKTAIELADELWVIEKQPQKGDFVDTASEYFIPKADIAVITSSAEINKSVERLLELSHGLTILIGPSTPMSPVLFDYGVDMLAGIKVVDEEGMMAKIAEGGGKVSQFEDAIEFLVMERWMR